MHTTLPSGCGSHVEFLTQSSHGSVTSMFSVYTGVYICVCICTYVYYIHIYRCTHLHTYILYVCTYNKYIHTYIQKS